jgi:hypothetical protein
MRKRLLLRRAIALHLLVVLPGVVGARLSLDARWTIDPRGHVEAEHDDGCAGVHDHRLCVLVLHTPWSPAASVPQLVTPAPSAQAASIAPDNPHYSGEVALPVARSPPSSI